MAAQRNTVDLCRDEFLPVISKVPKGHRHLVAKALGFRTPAEITNRRYMTVDLFNKMVSFVNDMDNVSNNTVGSPAKFDTVQASKYNSALLRLINSKEFMQYSSYNKYRIVLEQIDIQKKINRNK